MGATPLDFAYLIHSCIAAHWNYKEGFSNKDAKLDDKLRWLRQILWEAEKEREAVLEACSALRKELIASSFEDLLVEALGGESPLRNALDEDHNKLMWLEGCTHRLGLDGLKEPRR